MDKPATTATALDELLADPAMCEWLDSMEDPGDAGFYEDLHSLRNIPEGVIESVHQSLQDLYHSGIFTEGK